MEQTQLEIQVTEQILQNLEETKQTVEIQTTRLGDLLLAKIIRSFKTLDSQRVEDLFVRTFLTKMKEELDALFKHYKESEIGFYSKNLKTTDLIFNTLSDKRTQTIYLDNLIKKLSQKEDDLEVIFIESAKNKVSIEENEENIESEENLSIKEMFDQFVGVLAKNPHLSMDEADDLRNLANHYYNLYKTDVSSTIEKFLSDNKTMAVTKIEEEMDNKEVRNGKTSAVSKIEKTIANKYEEVMKQLLEKLVSKSKISAKEELKTSSLAIIDFVYNSLPNKTQEQKDLLEIIVDTNIERLGKLLDTETEQLEKNLHDKNKDIIINEFYEEKRYKDINDYECKFDSVGKIYQSILKEIDIAYAIPEDKSKKITFKVLSESESTKTSFQKLTNNIKMNNETILNFVVTEMHNASAKAQEDSLNNTNNEENSNPIKK